MKASRNFNRIKSNDQGHLCLHLYLAYRPNQSKEAFSEGSKTEVSKKEFMKLSFIRDYIDPGKILLHVSF